MSDKHINILRFLKENVNPATGCTEPIAVGYAVAIAYHAIFQETLLKQYDMPLKFKIIPPPLEPDRLILLEVKTDRNVYKNALNVAIPGANGQKGLIIAAAMGLFLDPNKALNLFDEIPSLILSKVKSIIEQKKVMAYKIENEALKSNLDIQITLKYKMNGEITVANVRLQDTHDNVTLIQVGDKVLYKGEFFNKEEVKQLKQPLPESIKELIELVKNITVEEKEEIIKGIEMNKNLVDMALKGDYGLNIGKNLLYIFREMDCENTLISQVKIQVALAGDVRMSGAKVPVMTTGGSGNHGIMAIIPVSVVGKIKNINRDKICEAVLLAHFITSLTDKYAGHLSALCGCAIKAGIAATAAITYLLGGELEQVNNAINLMAANNTGFICDGAKESCALKLSAAAGTAAESALLALKGVKVPADNGIIFENAEETLKAIGRISHSMGSTDIEITKIIEEKNENMILKNAEQ